MGEFWKDIKGYKGIYQVNDCSEIMNVATGKIRKCRQDKRGYCIIGLSNNGVTKTFYVHRIVAEAFMPDRSGFKSMPDEDRSKINLDDLVINHIDENKQNNNVSNLEWCTTKYNINYTWKNGHMPAPPPQEPYKVERNDGVIFNSLKEAGMKMGINPCIICNHLKGRQKTVKGYTFKYYKEVM